MARATIRDVAREAAVSNASVSRVLNGYQGVRPELRERVLTAAAALGHVMHAGARSLSLEKYNSVLASSNAIGVILPDLHGEYFSELLRGFDRAASARGLQLLLSNIHVDPDRAVEALHSMRGRVDGMIVMAPHIDPDRLFSELPRGVPTVFINCAHHAGGRAELRIDNEAGAKAMTRHLIESGRDHIVHIAGPSSNIEARDRVLGYEAAMAEAGLQSRILQGYFREEAGIAAADKLLEDLDGVDAVFAANDMIAIGLLVTLQRAGIDIPGQIAIAGFDDIPLACLISPALTTMHVGTARLGERAVERLIGIITGEVDQKVELITPVLVARATTGGTEPISRTARKPGVTQGEIQ